MELKQFMETATKIACDTPTRYQLSGWGQQDNGVYLFDCICYIKSILWGFDFEQGGHGGAVYCSNDVPDKNADDFFWNCCYNHSTDMSNIEEGELVYIRGHIGIYANNGNVYEATAAGSNKVLVSNIINGDGTRVVDGKYCGKWTHHAKCQFIDYAKPTSNLKYRASTKEEGWGEWKNEGDTAGSVGFGYGIDLLQIDSKDPMKVQASIEDTGWVDFGEINKDTIIGIKGKAIECLLIDGNYTIRILAGKWSNNTITDGKVTVGSVGEGIPIEAIKMVTGHTRTPL